MNMQDVIAAFGSVKQAREFIDSARLFVMGPTDGTETTMSKQMHAVFDLALVALAATEPGAREGE